MRLALISFCLAVTGLPSLAAAATLTVPTQHATISAAINASTAGDTIQIANSATYTEDLMINKRLTIAAAVGATPVIRNGGTSSATPVVFGPLSGGSQLGSLAGGRITLQYNKDTAANIPLQMLDFTQADGTEVVLENLLITQVGAATANAIRVINHNRILNNTITLRNVDINVNRGSAQGSVYGIYVGIDTAVPMTGFYAPTFNLERVRVEGYTRSAVWINGLSTVAPSPRVNIRFCEFGILGEQMGTTTSPWGAIIANQPGARCFVNIDRSLMLGQYGHSALFFNGDGSSVTLTRTVVVNKFAANTTTPRGALQLGISSLPGARGLRVEADHCDFVDRSPAGAAAAIVTDDVSTTQTMILTNCNVVSASTKAFAITVGAGDVFSSSHNNVFGAIPSTGYVAAATDKALDPQYQAIEAGDARYANNGLKKADSAGGPIGVNADHSDVVAGITPGTGFVNRAGHWLFY